jgi:hypothetical protein
MLASRLTRRRGGTLNEIESIRVVIDALRVDGDEEDEQQESADG